MGRTCQIKVCKNKNKWSCEFEKDGLIVFLLESDSKFLAWRRGFEN